MYNEVAKRATAKYRKDKQKQMSIEYKNDEFDRVNSLIEKSGMKRATFIKQAIEEKIAKDGLEQKEEVDTL
jgi:predicted DNA-binding protein